MIAVFPALGNVLKIRKKKEEIFGLRFIVLIVVLVLEICLDDSATSLGMDY